MQIKGKHYQTIWIHPENNSIVQTIDQRKLPFKLEIVDLKTSEDIYFAIKDMTVRGAPLIGITGAFGIYLFLMNELKFVNNIIDEIKKKAIYIKSARPTAINLAYAVDEVIKVIVNTESLESAQRKVRIKCLELLNLEVDYCKKIGEYGFSLIKDFYDKKNGETVNILTHCNAGWLACIDYGTATAPVYLAHDKGIKVHVWVDETRPRNQGARLTSWELTQHGVPNTVIADNTGGHLMQHGTVDLVIVGSDRTTVNGDVANKIGTYLKALAAFDNNIPFYAALPSSTIDWTLEDGIKNIPIEIRDENELLYLEGISESGMIEEFRIMATETNVLNYAFDVTPSRLVSGLITERGICTATKENIQKLFPEKF